MRFTSAHAPEFHLFGEGIEHGLFAGVHGAFDKLHHAGAAAMTSLTMFPN